MRGHTEPGRLAATRSSDRPRAHGGTSDTEVAIFDATERLLADVPLRELSVAQIISAAGISRATFYFYFSSKFAVLSGLLAKVMDETFEQVQPVIGRAGELAPEAVLEQSLSAAVKLWVTHRPALRAIHEHWTTTEELRTLWIGVLERFIDLAATEIDRQREAGLARPGVPSKELASVLIWGSERCLYVAGLGTDPNLPDEQSALAPLLAVWTAALYGL